METLTDALLWIAAISVGLMAGVYFTFSAFLMRSLDAIGTPAGMLAMQSINRIIVRSSFLPIFFGSTLVCTLLMVLMAMEPSSPGAIWALIGSAFYVVGMFIVTVVGNVPLNNRLEAADADGPDGARMWALYLRKWTLWNHVRTTACTACLVLLILAISART
jgi:uncharacterized membrane protein